MLMTASSAVSCSGHSTRHQGQPKLTKCPRMLLSISRSAPEVATPARAHARSIRLRVCPAHSSRRGSRQKVAAEAPVGVPAYVSKETFTNPTGEVIKPIRDNLWKVDRPFVWLSIDVGSCMVVIKLKDGSLWVHSPVSLDKELMETLADIGPVKHIVSPNYEHLKFAAQWIDAYPDATSYACPGLIELHPEIPYTTSVGVENTTPASWPSEIEVTHMAHEVNPLNGNPFFNEVLFCHTPSKTLIITDFFWNWPEDVPPATRAFKFGMDVVYKPVYFNFMIKHPAMDNLVGYFAMLCPNKRGFVYLEGTICPSLPLRDMVSAEGYRSAMERLLGQEWDAIIPCHGDPVYDDAKGVLRHFAGFS